MCLEPSSNFSVKDEFPFEGLLLLQASTVPHTISSSFSIITRRKEYIPFCVVCSPNSCHLISLTRCMFSRYWFIYSITCLGLLFFLKICTFHIQFVISVLSQRSFPIYPSGDSLINMCSLDMVVISLPNTS